MKIALKYGLLITAGVIVWVVAAHLLVPNPCSTVHVIGPLVLFNVLEFAGVYLGIVARKREAAGQLNFKAALKTGVAIAFVYGFSSCLFFLLLLIVVGSKVMCAPPGASFPPLWQLAAFAFAAQFLFAVILGLIYSTIVAFVLATRSRS